MIDCNFISLHRFHLQLTIEGYNIYSREEFVVVLVSSEDE